MNATQRARSEPLEADEHDWDTSLFDLSSWFDLFVDGDASATRSGETSVQKPAD